MKLQRMRKPFDFSQNRRSFATAISLVAVAGLVGCSAGGGASAEPSKDNIETVQLVVPAAVAILALPEFANERGFFEEAGVDVDVVILGAGQATSALTGGSAQFVITGSPGPDTASFQGAPIKAVGTYANRSTARVLLGDGVDSIADLKGKSVGIDAPGAQTDILFRLALEEAGLSDGDVTIRPMGDLPAIIAAFQSGQLDGALFAEPLVSDLLATTPGSSVGMELADVTPWNFACVYTNSDWAAENPETAAKVVDGLNRAVEAWWEDPEAAKESLKNFTKAEDPNKVYEDVLRVMTKSLEPLSADTQTVVLEAMKENGVPDLVPEDWEKWVDNSFVEQLN